METSNAVKKNTYFLQNFNLFPTTGVIFIVIWWKENALYGFCAHLPKVEFHCATGCSSLVIMPGNNCSSFVPATARTTVSKKGITQATVSKQKSGGDLLIAYTYKSLRGYFCHDFMVQNWWQFLCSSTKVEVHCATDALDLKLLCLVIVVILLIQLQLGRLLARRETLKLQWGN